ncbi:ankyrin protein [Fusarium sp. NRRL 52700]|nr:ankyrin protein [Fusarium sp. NRRL 52700]
MSQATRKKLESVLETLGVDRQKSRSPLETENSGHFIQLMEIVQLVVAADDARPTCLIIDGLDQCEDEFIIRLLRGLDMMFRRGSSASALKVVVTSRMADSIRGFALANNHIEVTPDLILDDIKKVVDEEVDRIILSRRIATVGRASVSAVIVERSNGSFLFASAVLKELWHIKDTGANSVFTLITSCPPTMEAIYQQDMDRIQNERNDLFQLIQIICIARSTLRTEEAKEVLRFLNPSVTRTYDLVGDLTRTCQRLIRFGAEETIELLHQTLYDFILDTYDVNLVHQTLATACLKYKPIANTITCVIQGSDTEPLVFLAEWDADLVIKEIFSHTLELSPNPFLHKIHDLLLHNSPKPKQEVEEDLKTLVNNIWEGTTAIHHAAAQPGAALEVLMPFSRNLDLPDNDGSTPLTLSAVRGHGRSVRALLEAGAKVDVVDPWNETALFTAVDVGAVDVVRTLLEFGADPNISSINVWRNERLIHMACFKGWKGVVERLIEKQANLNDPPRDLPKASPVALAAESGHSDILRALLAAGTAVECPVEGMSSPLHITVAAQNLLGCELLLEAGCQVNAEHEDGSTALSVAADLNDLDMVECLVSHGADPSKPDYETPLHIAVDWGNLEMAEIILSSRFFSDIDAKGEKGYTALGIAATTGRLDIVSMLLDHGADPNMRNGQHNSSAPLHIAANKGHRSIVIELLKRGADPYPETTKESSAFHAACIGGWLDVIETFLEVVDDVGELVNFEWGWAGTPLKAAASGGKLDAVKLLLSKGADPNKKLQSKINRGQTVIHAAAEGGDTQVLEAILDAVDDSSLEIRDRAQRTPFWYACVEGHEDMVKYLLERGASTDVIFDDGENIIPAIVSGGSEKNLKLILEKNPNLDTDCILADGETPLFKAVYSGHGKVVSILLERGADVNRRSKYGNVPVFVAITNRQNETLRILLEHESIDLTQRDSFDRTALQIAPQSGTHLMPAMVLGAAKDSDVEEILTEKRDMYGLNAYDLTRPEANNPALFDRCVEGVRRDAQSLLDDFDLHGVRWERLGKFLLQLRSYSFAQIALQRSARAVETTPLVLKHDNYCDMCLDTIVGPRYVCCTCCTVDLCESCVRRDKKPGNRTWTCDYHSFLAVHLPKIQAPDVILRTEIDFHVPTRLSPIEEVASETSQGWTEAEGNEPSREPSSLLDDAYNSYTMAMEPLVTQPSTAVTGSSFDGGGLLDKATNSSSALAKEEWSDKTEDELREFLEAVLKTFTTYQTPNGISKCNFSIDGWTLRYKDDALKSSWVEGDENAKLIHPAREWTPLQPSTEAYYYLSGLSYIMEDVAQRCLGLLQPLPKSLDTLEDRGFCFRCVPKQRHELSNLPPPNDWELAMFILASFYRPIPVCLFCRKFSDGGIDCGEHSDFEEDDRRDANSIDPTDAILVGKYPQPSIHSFVWGPREGVVGGMELPSLEDAGVTMDWFTEQLRIEQEWAKLYPYALSPIAESGIMFIMMTSAPQDSWDKMKTLILVNKFLKGLVSGSHTENNKTRLFLHPWPQPEFMPKIDPRGSLRPSPLNCPKANLQEIFSTFFDHVVWTRATDVHSFKSQAPRNTYDHVRREYLGKALLSRTLGCHLAASDARSSSILFFAIPYRWNSAYTQLRQQAAPCPNRDPRGAFRMAAMESNTISDQFRTIELEDSGEEDNDSEMEEDDSEDESDSEMDED